MIYGTVRVRIDSESLSFVIPNMGLIMCIFGSFAKISMGEVLENEGGGGEGEVGGEAPTLSGLELKAQACCCCSFTPNNFQK